MNNFSLFFLSALFILTITKLWLALRHKKHVALNRSSVPTPFTEKITLENHQKAADYTIAKIKIGISSIIFDSFTLLILLFGGILQILQDFSTDIFSGDILAGSLLVIMLILITSCLNLPFDLYRTFVIETKFGFNRMNLKTWMSDGLKQAFISAIFGIPLLFLLLFFMQSMGPNWWIYAWGLVVIFMLFMQLIAPTYIAPIFNTFTPMAEGEMKIRIEKLIQRCGFNSGGLYIMDGSKRSSHGNAYFTGFGRTKRIVFFDTLIERLNIDEIEAVLAHELGHFKMRHVLKRLVLLSIFSGLFFYLLGLLQHEEWFFVGLNINFPANNAMALVLFFLTVPVFTFFLQPIMSIYSRKHEFEADAYAAQFAPSEDLISALVKLYKDNASTLTPDPLHSAWYDSHPPASVRISKLRDLQIAT